MGPTVLAPLVLIVLGWALLLAALARLSASLVACAQLEGLARPTTRALTAPCDVVKLRGTLITEAPVPAPFTRTASALCEWALETRDGDGWRVHASRVAHRPLWLEHEGGRVRLELTSAPPPRLTLAASDAWSMVAAWCDLEFWVEADGGPPVPPLAPDVAVRCRERVLRPGEQVTVVGELARDDGWVLRGAAARPLELSNLSPAALAQLVARAAERVRVSKVMVRSGAALIVAGGIWLIVAGGVR